MLSQHGKIFSYIKKFTLYHTAKLIRFVFGRVTVLEDALGNLVCLGNLGVKNRKKNSCQSESGQVSSEGSDDSHPLQDRQGLRTGLDFSFVFPLILPMEK